MSGEARSARLEGSGVIRQGSERADQYRPGGPQPSFDKQFLRDFLDANGWNKQPPPPRVPQDVIDGTAERYTEALQRLTA